jgi:hypothetical protein
VADKSPGAVLLPDILYSTHRQYHEGVQPGDLIVQHRLSPCLSILLFKFFSVVVVHCSAACPGPADVDPGMDFLQTVIKGDNVMLGAEPIDSGNIADAEFRQMRRAIKPTLLESV